jgi:hypothetical protein
MKKSLVYLLAAFIVVALVGCGPKAEGPQADQAAIAATAQAPEKVGPFGVLHRGVATDIPEPAQLSADEAKRKEIAERLDKEKLLASFKIVEDKSENMLQAPENIRPFVGKDIVMAKVPPAVEFAVVPAKPLFFAEPPAGNHVGPWSNWSQAVFHAKTGKFYSSVGDHGAYDAHTYIVEYDPASKTVRCLPEINHVLGRTADQFGEGKIHGWLDFYPQGSSNLWFCTYWAKYPEPEERDYATGYDGGHIMSLNVETGDIVDYGVPIKRASYPYHRVDTRRGIMYAVGMFGEFLAWDINAQKTLWAGYLPEGLTWWNRAIMIDEETGFAYTTNMEKGDTAQHFIKYDPAKNRIFKLAAQTPMQPAFGPKLPARRSEMRAQTSRRGPDGLFWGVSRDGELFTFDPVKEEVVDKGVNWPGEEKYTTSMARSPKGRYVYYLPGAHGESWSDGSPVIQYDTVTGTKKVLAFLHPYFYKKYGYTMGGTFSISLDTEGARLFVLMNGGFVDLEEMAKTPDSGIFGHCSALLIHIPESERVE